VGALRVSGRRDVRESYGSLREADFERVGRLEPEAKVNMAIEMTEAMVRVCLDGIRGRNPSMAEEELMEELRERLEWAKRWQHRGGHVK
jgi:hypothetical protein